MLARFGIAVGLWYTLMFPLALTGAFEHTIVGGVPILVLGSYIVPLTAFILVRRIASVRAWMDQLDMRVVMVLHSARWVAFGTLLVAFYRMTSPWWAVSAGVGDITSAIALTYLSMRGFQTGRLRRAHVRFWNLFGLVDFTHAITLVLLLFPGSLGVLAGATPATDSTLAFAFPFVVIPLCVPLLVCCHLIVLAQVRGRESESEITFGKAQPG